MKKLIYLITISVIFSACSTDLDVNGNWKETTIVYGLLDQSQSKQYIKINKAFLGEGNALSFAQVKDSTQYANVLDVKLKRLSDGTLYNLSPDNSVPKSPLNEQGEAGTFYWADQANAIFSYASTDKEALDAKSSYQLIIKNNESGKEVTATTTLVKDFGNFLSPSMGSPSFGLIFPNFNDFKFIVKWNSAPNARLYQLKLRFHYKDSTLTGTENKFLDKAYTEIKTQKLEGGEAIEYGINGQDYLRFIGYQLSDYPGLIARIPGNLDIIVVAAGDELSTFIEVNAPSTGIIQEKPEYTNISNGLGIFSSRYYKTPFSRPLAPPTLDSLSGGQYTCGLKFLDHTGNWIGCQ